MSQETVERWIDTETPEDLFKGCNVYVKSLKTGKIAKFIWHRSKPCTWAEAYRGDATLVMLTLRGVKPDTLRLCEFACSGQLATILGLQH